MWRRHKIMVVFRRKQIVILALVLMIVVAGYLQYTYKAGSNSDELAGQIGDAVLVDNEEGEQAGAENLETDGIAWNSGAQDTSAAPGVSASKEANDFFAQAKMNREITRDKTTKTLKSITSDKSAPEETISKAYDQLMALTEIAEKEMRIETLISKMGFNDCVALFADDGSVDIVVKTPELTDAQVAQIADIVSRQANVDIADINIKKIY